MNRQCFMVAQFIVTVTVFGAECVQFTFMMVLDGGLPLKLPQVPSTSRQSLYG
ncbi:MAG: hypothetical protein JST06_05135 [Bacteroidetes bacterium]|nr:hypothetical protein [Bacteroidota bacterium]MBS1629813.1 hypothetical protein [Bacteroidota bacterium]